MEGHSDYGDMGSDIVCAAASGIFYELCSYLLNFKGENFKINAIKSGLADIECDCECEEALKQACLGLWQIAFRYPENLLVNVDAWHWKMAPCREI
jgi:uncharacterized protein YsxB (DUF464 family)